MPSAFMKTHKNWFYPSKYSQLLKNLFEFFIVSKKMILATMLLYSISDMSC